MKGKLLSKYKSVSVQARAAIWFSVCSILQKGISFIVVPIFTRLLTSEQYGVYSLYLSWLQILTIITSLYLYFGVFTNGMNKYEEDRDKYASAMQGLVLTITSVVFVIFLLTKELWSRILGLAPSLIFLMFVEMAVTPALSFWSGKQRFEYKYKRLVAVTLGKSLANPVIGLLLVYLSKDKALARIASVVIVECLFCVPILLLQFKRGKCWYHPEYWKYALGLAIPLLPHYLSGMILNKGDQIMISKMIGTSEVAFYSVAYNIGMLVQIFTNAISNSFTPWVYQRIKADNYKGIDKTINFLLLLVSGISLSLMLLSPELVLIFGSTGYSSAAYVIPPVSASVFFIFLYNILATPQFYFEKTKFLMGASVFAAIINLGLNYIFIQQYGFIAAGYTTLFCYILYSLGHYLVSKSIMKIYIPGKKLFDYKMIFILSLVMILSGIGCNFVFDYPIIRFGILVILGVIILVKRESIFGKIKDIKRR